MLHMQILEKVFYGTCPSFTLFTKFISVSSVSFSYCFILFHSHSRCLYSCVTWNCIAAARSERSEVLSLKHTPFRMHYLLCSAHSSLLFENFRVYFMMHSCSLCVLHTNYYTTVHLNNSKTFYIYII